MTTGAGQAGIDAMGLAINWTMRAPGSVSGKSVSGGFQIWGGFSDRADTSPAFLMVGGLPCYDRPKCFGVGVRIRFEDS